MKKTTLMCLLALAIIICLSGLLGFLLYQQKQIINEQKLCIQELSERLVDFGKAYDKLNQEYQQMYNEVVYPPPHLTFEEFQEWLRTYGLKSNMTIWE